MSRTSPMLLLLVGLQVPVADDMAVTPFASYAGGGVGKTRIQPSGNGRCVTKTLETSSSTGEEDAQVYVLTVGVGGSISWGL